MSCKKCLIDFNMPGWYKSLDDSLLCEDCKYVIKQVNDFAYRGYHLYHLDLQKAIYGLMPIKSGGQVILVNPNQIDLTRFTEDDIICELTQRLGIIDKEYIGKKSINDICNQIMGFLLDDLYSYIQSNPIGYLMALLTVLEYNTSLSEVTVSWLNNVDKNKISPDDIKDNFGRLIVESFKFLKDSQLNCFPIVYKDWEGILAFDKLAFQYGIELIVNYLTRGGKFNEPFRERKFGKIIQLIRAIYFVLETRDRATEKIFCIDSIRIDSQGSIRIVETKDSYLYYSELAIEYIDAMTSREAEDLDQNYKNQLNIVCKKYLGIKMGDMMELCSQLKNNYKLDEYLMGDMEYYAHIVHSLLRCTYDEALAFINILTHDLGMAFQYATTTSERKNRPLRKCLIPVYNDIMVCPVGLIIFSILGLYVDIVEGRVMEERIQKRIEEVREKINLEFESLVACLLKKSFDSSIVKQDIRMRDIRKLNSKGFVLLPGQVDILFLHRGRLYVVECKDFSLRTTTKSLGNELNSLRKTKHKSDQMKLKEKIEVIYNEWESVMHHLGVDDIASIPRCRPIGLFVTNSFSIAALEKEMMYPVIPYNRLVDWFNNLASV